MKKKSGEGEDGSSKYNEYILAFIKIFIPTYDMKERNMKLAKNVFEKWTSESIY